MCVFLQQKVPGIRDDTQRAVGGPRYQNTPPKQNKINKTNQTIFQSFDFNMKMPKELRDHSKANFRRATCIIVSCICSFNLFVHLAEQEEQQEDEGVRRSGEMRKSNHPNQKSGEETLKKNSGRGGWTRVLFGKKVPGIRDNTQRAVGGPRYQNTLPRTIINK